MDVDPFEVLLKALSVEGRPTVWGRKGPMAFDCSGLVTWALRQAGGPDWRNTHNAQALAELFQPMASVPAGAVALAFYGQGWERVKHVMFVCPDGRAYGACGATPTVITVERAIEIGHRVRYRSSASYRTDLLGFRALTLRFLHAPPPGENSA